MLNQSETSSDLATRIRIEYDRECYKQAEARVRGQLDKLQVSVKETIKAVNGPPPPERRQPATP